MNDNQIIENLTQKLEEATKPKWVSVRDMIPPAHEWYLIVSLENQSEGMVTMAFLDNDHDGNPVWLVHNDGNKSSNSDEWEDVTHWQPLPAPPTEANQ